MLRILFESWLYMRIIILLLTSTVLVTSCAKKKKFTEPQVILRKWSSSIRDFNYSRYKECEAYPREYTVFKEMYRDYYPSNITITKIEPEEKGKVFKDHNGHSFTKRLVYFTAKEMDRKTRREKQILQGDVLFIRFTDGNRRKEGWLMSNRTLMRLGQ